MRFERRDMSWLTQIVAVTLLNLRTLRQRLGSSAVAVVGIAGVVIVLVAVLSMAEGFFAAMTSAGAADRALVMRSGATDEMTSVLPGPSVDIITQAPGVRREGSQALVSGELFVLIDLPKRSTMTPANVPMRGIGPATPAVRYEARITEGRMLQFGTNEVVAGRAAVGQFAGLSVGSRITSGRNGWVVVGIFDTGGTVSETEVWADARVLQGAYQRGNSFQSVLARLESPASFTSFKDWLTSNPQLNVTVEPEAEYYRAQTVTLTNLIRTLGFGIAALMGIGAVFGAVLTMYTAVAARTREIATLRALGFNTVSVVVSVLVESLGLAALGGAIGGLVALVAFNGYQASTMNWQTFSQVAFAFRVTPALLGQGLAYALVMGFVGGLMPAVKAARLPISSALREL
jgi:putative ABC transport system permease protein